MLTAVYAVTDGTPGMSGSPFDPGSGPDLLVHSTCRLADLGLPPNGARSGHARDVGLPPRRGLVHVLTVSSGR